MQPVFLDRVRRHFVWINARAETADEPSDATLVASSYNIVIDCDVFLPELHLVGHIGEQATDSGGRVQHMGRLDSFE